MKKIKVILVTVACLYLIGGVGLYLLQEAILFPAERLDDDYTYDFAFPFEERNYKMEDGAVVNALFLPADSSRGVILYAHGNAGSLARWGEIGEELTRFNYDVLIYDYRGYGKSRGERTYSSFAADAQVLYNELKKDYPENRIFLYGRSLGTGIVTQLAAQNQPGTVILETPYFSMPEVAAYHYRVFPAGWMVRYPFPSDQFIRKIDCPIYILHGTDDRVVPYSSGKKLFDLIADQENAHLLTIDGGGHNDLAAFQEYWEEVEQILENE